MIDFHKIFILSSIFYNYVKLCENKKGIDLLKKVCYNIGRIRKRERAMSQKQKLIQAIKKVGCEVGIISDSVDYLKDSDIKKIIKDLEEYETTYKMKVKKETMLVEHETIEIEKNILEKDITIKPLSYYS